MAIKIIVSETYAFPDFDKDPTKTKEIAAFKFIDLGSQWSVTINGSFAVASKRAKSLFGQFFNTDYGQLHLVSTHPVKVYLG